MILKIYFTVFLLASFLAINGQVENTNFKSTPEYSLETTFYSGSVTKITDNTPLDSVEISVEKYGIVGYTNKDGFFQVKAPVNISKLFFRKCGYIGASNVFVLENERKNALDIKLFPEAPDEKEKELILKNYQLNSSNDSSGEILQQEESLLKATGKTVVPLTIRVLMPDNTVVIMDMDEYLKGVVPSEVPPSWDMNALKAQAVAARSYASVNYKHNSEGADVCTTTHCQVWKSRHYDKTDQAVTETSNVSVTYEGNIIDALFFSHCNGNTRNNEDVWGGTPVPYLRSKSCSCGYTFHNAHGVGMCQYGSNAMASAGSNWETILTYYYTGTKIDKPTSILGTLKGVIYYGNDNSNLNNRIVGATIAVNTGQQAISDGYGAYSFDLTPGRYTITASKDGFQSSSVTKEVTSGNTIWGSIQLDQTVGLYTVQATKEYIHPNPAKDFVTIELIGKSQIIITNLTGQILYVDIKNETTIIDVSYFKRGVYIIKIVGSNYIISKKIILSD